MSAARVSTSFQFKDPTPELPAEANIRIKLRKRTYDNLIKEEKFVSIAYAVAQPEHQLINEFDLFGKSVAAQLKKLPMQMAIKA